MKKKVRYLVILVLFAIGGLIGARSWSLSGETKVLSATSETTVEERLASLENRVWNLEKNAGLVKSSGSAKTKEQFLSLTGGFGATNVWSKISGTEFYFDSLLYGNKVVVTWEGWLEKEGLGGVRLYDSTNHRVVDNSEQVTTGNNKTSFYSKQLSIWRGQNLYYIEARSDTGEIKLTSPRLKIVSK